MKSTCNSKGQISKIGKITYRNVAKDFFSLHKLGSIHYIIMSTRLLFLPFLIALAGFVSCDEIQPDVAVGCVTVDNEYFCALTSAIGGETEGNQKWAFALWQVFRSYRKSLCQIKISFHLFTKSSKVSPVQRMAGLVLGQAQLCRCPNMFVVSECFFKYCA